MVDPTDLAIALDNLLDNAIAYTDAGSVAVRIEADASEVRVAVVDTGPGIALEHQPRSSSASTASTGALA